MYSFKKLPRFSKWCQLDNTDKLSRIYEWVRTDVIGKREFFFYMYEYNKRKLIKPESEIRGYLIINTNSEFDVYFDGEIIHGDSVGIWIDGDLHKLEAIGETSEFQTAIESIQKNPRDVYNSTPECEHGLMWSPTTIISKHEPKFRAYSNP